MAKRRRRSKRTHAGPPQRELGPEQLRALKDHAVSPWPRADAVADEAQRAALDALHRATGERGLPMPAGFVLDPFDAAARIAAPAPQPEHRVVLGYHPRFGLLHGSGDGWAELLPVRAVDHPWTPAQPTLSAAVPVARSWPELVDYLLALERAQQRAYWLWLRVGAHRGEERLPNRWGWLDYVTRLQRRELLAELVSELGLEPAHGYRTGGAFDGERGALFDFDEHVLCCLSSAGDVEQVLRFAGEHALPAVPEAWGGETRYGRAPPRNEAACFELEAAGPPRRRVTVVRDDDSFVWEAAHDDTLMFRRRVQPNRVPIARAPLLPGTTARVARHLARTGACIVPALRSVDGVRSWLGESGTGDRWQVLAELEERAGGLVFRAEWGMSSPDRFGPYLMLADRESLEPCGLNAPYAVDDVEGEHEPEDTEQLPWPLLRRRGIELAVVGYAGARIDSAYCCDSGGTLYYQDHEFEQLTPLANDATTWLEKRALREELRGGGYGILAEPAFAFALDVDERLTARLGLERVSEASDGISSFWVGGDAVLVQRHEHRLHRPLAEVFAPSPARAVAIAEQMRARYRRATLYVRYDAHGRASRSRRHAFEQSDLTGLEWVSSMNWRRWQD